ncbi:hypothetical protein R1sor_022072 [Riccia sorocarpa]|uniref:Chromatin target of PRMT1 protein C-terminal domain-containing protein n=1 Tax=Riccia sorocarpa TaxID=122646 RepID=A0ABD3GKC7_9MARC
MQGGYGRGGRHGYNARGAHGGAEINQFNGGGGVTYGGLPEAYIFNPWLGGFSAYNIQGLMPTPPVLPRSYTRGSGGTRPGSFVPLAVQGAGILKRPAGPPQGSFAHGRQSRGHGVRSWGSRGRKEKNVANLTKEALDADLDEWRMKDKKLGGSSLDAELDEYWKKKDEMEAEQGEDVEAATDSKSKAGETSSSSTRQEAVNTSASRLSDIHTDSADNGKEVKNERGLPSGGEKV